MPSTRKKATRPATVQPIASCLWFDDEGEEAARFYVSIFTKAKIKHITRYPAVGQEIPPQSPARC